MVKCPGCGTDVAIDAAMCYACGEKLGNPFNLDAAQKDLYEKAGNEMDRGNWAKAIDYYLALVKLRPDVGHFLACIGMAYAFLDRNGDAWDYYTRAVGAEPDNEDIWRTRLEFALEDGEQRLKAHIEEYLAHFKDSSEAKLRLAESILLVSDKHDETVAELCRQVLNREPENRKALKLKKKVEKGPGLLSKVFGGKRA